MTLQVNQTEPEENLDSVETVDEGTSAEAEVEAQPEAQPETEEKPEEKPYVRPVRQWVTLHSGSLDQRVGLGIVEKVGKDSKALSGLPRLALIAHTPSAPEELLEELRRRLVGSTFKVEFAQLGEGLASRTLAEANAFVAQLAGYGVTGDDVIVAVGDANALSVASYVASGWFGGTVLVQVPTDLEASVIAGVTPYPLDVPGAPATVGLDSSCRMSVTDFAYLDIAGDSEAVRMARALMVASSVLESDHTFAHLWNRADKLAAGVLEDVCQQIAETVRTRGRTISSASIAVRQSIDYGFTIAAAFQNLVPDAPRSLCLAEALRLSARLGVSENAFPLDDMLAQDELLETLELGSLAVDLDPFEMHAAIKSECLRRTNRFMLLLPQALGRVRLVNVDSDRLLEHCHAWCAAHTSEEGE